MLMEPTASYAIGVADQFDALNAGPVVRYRLPEYVRLPPTRAPFDTFLEAVRNGDADVAGRLPDAAYRGLKLFIGKGDCAACHLHARSQFSQYG